MRYVCLANNRDTMVCVCFLSVFVVVWFCFLLFCVVFFCCGLFSSTAVLANWKLLRKSHGVQPQPLTENCACSSLHTAVLHLKILDQADRNLLVDHSDGNYCTKAAMQCRSRLSKMFFTTKVSTSQNGCLKLACSAHICSRCCSVTLLVWQGHNFTLLRKVDKDVVTTCGFWRGSGDGPFQVEGAHYSACQVIATFCGSTCSPWDGLSSYLLLCFQHGPPFISLETVIWEEVGIVTHTENMKALKVVHFLWGMFWIQGFIPSKWDQQCGETDVTAILLWQTDLFAQQ